MSSYRIGVDGGGSNTRAVVIDERLHVLGRGEAGSSNHYAVGLRGAAENIQTAVGLALEIAGLRQSEVASWGFGLAGACSAAEQGLITDALQPIFGAEASLTVDEDAAAAWAGAFATPEGTIEPGAICIAGTGANCFGVNAGGERARADGLGPLLGDRGSGYWIGEATLRAVCAAYDGAYPETALFRPVLDYYGAASVDDLIPIVYAPDFSRARLAGVLPILIQLAPEDAVAARILREAGEQLAITTSAVLKKLGLDAVAVTGGVLQNAALVREAYETALRERIPGVTVIEPRYDAIIGAALLGKK